MNNVKKVLEQICTELNNNDYECNLNFLSKSTVFEFSRPTGISLYIYYDKRFSNPNYFLLVKPDKFTFDGDKTDLIDIIAFSLATYFRCFKLDSSCFINTISDNIGEIYTEIDYAILSLQQLNNRFFQNDWIKTVRELIYTIINFEASFWNSLGCPCYKCKISSGLDNFLSFELPDYLNKAIARANMEGVNVNTLSRKLPYWSYFKNFDKKVSIVNSSHLALLLKEFIKNNDYTKFDCENNIFLISNNSKNVITKPTYNTFYKHIKYFENDNSVKIELIAFENGFILVGNNFVLLKNCDTGFNRFRKEKEKIRKRHFLEARLIFPPSKFVWNEKIDPERFENMIKDILCKEENIKSVRKTGSINNSDNGRDMIALIEQTNLNAVEDLEIPKFKTETLRVVVQCKAYSKSIGKAQVSDIRDTIEFHKSRGFFLIVSSLVTNALISHLELLKENGYFIDWWTKDEIEERLVLNGEILLNYKDIVNSIEV